MKDSVVYVNIESTPVGQNVVLKLIGRMDANNSSEFEQACAPWIAQGTKHIVVDMSELAYVSSMGLRYFVNVGKVLNDKGGSLRISGIHGLVKQLFEITRLTNVFPMYGTVEAATADL